MNTHMDHKQTRNNSTSYDHAIVIGGSMAGLLAARVLSDTYTRVTIIERDRLPDAATLRKGVPQARHVHQLFERGREIVESYFPGIVDELKDGGATMVDAGSDLAWLHRAGWAPDVKTGIDMLSCSRTLLEWSVRQRVRAISNVKIVEQTDVLGLIGDRFGQAVVGVEMQRRDATVPRIECETARCLSADLVVDASGRSSRAPQWLEALGYAPPRETVLDAHIWYASRIYQVPENIHREWQGIYLQSAPPEHSRIGIMLPIEGNRWLVSINGIKDDPQPRDDAAFLAFLKTLRSPMLYDVLKDAKPLTPIAGNRNTANRLRHYDKLKRHPEGFIALGDAVCTFSPIYGQGMTVAALESVALAACLDTQRNRQPNGTTSGFARRFQKEIAKIVAAPWLLATSEDSRFTHVDGTQPTFMTTRMTKVMHWYMNNLLRVIVNDVPTFEQFIRVVHMIDPTDMLFKPAILSKVISAAITREQRADDAFDVANTEINQIVQNPRNANGRAGTPEILMAAPANLVSANDLILDEELLWQAGMIN